MILELEGVTVLRGGSPVVEDAWLTVPPGGFACLYGRSGSGKTTLLRVAALVERPAAGRVKVAGVDYTGAGEAERARARRLLIGYIPQFHGLIEDLTAEENIVIPLLAAGVPPGEARERAREAAEALGIGGLLGRRVSQLSGGQRQRVAVARALAKRPVLVVADEPTASLDDESARAVAEALRAVAEEGGGVLAATPDPTEPLPCTARYRITAGRVSPA